MEIFWDRDFYKKSYILNNNEMRKHYMVNLPESLRREAVWTHSNIILQGKQAKTSQRKIFWCLPTQSGQSPSEVMKSQSIFGIKGGCGKKKKNAAMKIEEYPIMSSLVKQKFSEFLLGQHSSSWSKEAFPL